ncbi:MAG: threonyl-tRNA synthetase editing domain-containing protein, partial [Candidatus Diapherotrites archaeon]|nr:threonyl-tRNA synthetase editing domain-containing protein [Candidatus Diapherotrites archaeon]
PAGQIGQQFRNCLVVFLAVEENDSISTIKTATGEIARFAQQNQNIQIVVHPFAHLSSRLAKPKPALELSILLQTTLSQVGSFEVLRTPFGWYKQFSIDVKGHANSQVYREF